MGPKERRSSVLSAMEEAAIVALRVQARLPLDDVYIALKDVIPQLTRSNLHRCLQRHGISRPPKADRAKPKKFKAYGIGYFHIDIAELRHEGGKGFLFVAVDRTSKLVFARIHRQATKLAAAAFLKVLVRTVPYKLHTVLTDNGVQFVQPERGGNRGFLIHIFERTCRENGIEHRLTKPYHPWTNGQSPPRRRPGSSAWSAPSRKRRSDPSTTPRSTSCAGSFATGSQPTTSPSSSKPCALKRPTKQSNSSGRPSPTSSIRNQTITRCD